MKTVTEACVLFFLNKNDKKKMTKTARLLEG